MIRSAHFRTLSALFGALVLSSCSDAGFRSPTGPTAEAVTSVVDAPLKGSPDNLELTAVWWTKNLKSSTHVSKTIDPSGGVISMPGTGLTVVFPQGAVSAPIRITVTADDKYVAYKMEPTGTRFLKDVTVIQLLSFTKVGGLPLKSQLFAAYIADDKLNLSGTVPVLEIEPSNTVLSPRTQLPESQVWVIRHFSRYMLASGRR